MKFNHDIIKLLTTFFKRIQFQEDTNIYIDKENFIYLSSFISKINCEWCRCRCNIENRTG